jgi:hypothetical protein
LQQRDHDEFVVRLKDIMPDKQQLVQDLQDNATQHFDLQAGTWHSLSSCSQQFCPQAQHSL